MCARWWADLSTSSTTAMAKSAPEMVEAPSASKRASRLDLPRWVRRHGPQPSDALLICRWACSAAPVVSQPRPSQDFRSDARTLISSTGPPSSARSGLCPFRMSLGTDPEVSAAHARTRQTLLGGSRPDGLRPWYAPGYQALGTPDSCASRHRVMERVKEWSDLLTHPLREPTFEHIPSGLTTFRAHRRAPGRTP